MFFSSSRGGVWGGGKSLRRGTPVPRSRKTNAAAYQYIRRLFVEFMLDKFLSQPAGEWWYCASAHSESDYDKSLQQLASEFVQLLQFSPTQIFSNDLSI